MSATPRRSPFPDFSAADCDAVWRTFDARSALAAGVASLLRPKSASSSPTRFITSGMESELTLSEPKLSAGSSPLFITLSRRRLRVMSASEATPMSIASFALK